MKVDFPTPLYPTTIILKYIGLENYFSFLLRSAVNSEWFVKLYYPNESLAFILFKILLSDMSDFLLNPSLDYLIISDGSLSTTSERTVLFYEFVPFGFSYIPYLKSIF